ncbi:hypothetical protein DPMN_055828 [Dreissena polymorpha]|uniref:Uncharacterized protein n=1 Tax=Dreissena polymorpha TaxID=45954 RepID=A0A9D4HT22_DREPO|nr:hypothetical protein DPMN_055828 [Dreissena polymorpha]
MMNHRRRGELSTYMSVLLNKPVHANHSEIPPTTKDMPIKYCILQMEEIRSSNKQLKKGKYAGPDSIPQKR